jgi:hypothetical protein
MKHLILFSFFFILCCSIAEAQTPTYAGIPGPENVLVVYKIPNDTTDTLGVISEQVKNYYVNARNIPNPLNVFGLNLPDSIQITSPYEGTTHWVGIRQSTDIIRDLDNQYAHNWTPSFHAFQYYLENT